jgi:two-component system chemotaxis response regulator CheY
MGNKILICDDAAFMRMLLRRILTKGGYEIIGEADNGLNAINKYKELKPDLLTLDITMPEMDGLQALKKIKEIDPEAKVIMCTAMGQEGMVIDALVSGASDFIVKPFQEDRVLNSVRKLIP